VFVKLALIVVVGAVAAAVWFAGIGRGAPSADRSAATPQATPGEQTIQLTEADLNQRLTQQLVGQPLGNTPLGTATLESISTQLTDGHLIANGDAKLASTRVPVTLTATGSVENGRAVVTVDDLKAAGVPLPSNARQSVQQALQSQLDAEVNRQQLRVSSMSIANGKLTLTGTR
jgi:DUF2993 family protein